MCMCMCALLLGQENKMASDELQKVDRSSHSTIIDSNSVEDRHCQKTRDSTQWGVRVFTDFCHEVGISVVTASIDVPTLCLALKRLYAGARTKKCELYQLTAFRSLRYALKRHFEKTLKVDIIKDNAFADANEAFFFMEKRIKAEGKGLIRHYPPVEEEDMTRLKEYFKNNMQNPTPRKLLEYVWFILQYYMCRLGRDGQTELKVTSFVIRTDAHGEKSIVQNESELLNPGNGESEEEVSGGLIPAIKGDVLCPVRAFELYISKLHKDIDRLFQKPKKIVDAGQPYWFDRVPYGKTPLGGMMPTLSHNANLSKRYTNHSLRATAIEKLIWSGINKKEVRSISQRRSDSGLENYGHSTSVLQRKKMASILSNIGGGDERGPTTTTNSVYENNNTKLLNNNSSLKTNSITSNLIHRRIMNNMRELKQPAAKSSISFSQSRKKNSNVIFSRTRAHVPRHFKEELESKQSEKSWTNSNISSNNNNRHQQLNVLKKNKTSMRRVIGTRCRDDIMSTVNKTPVVNLRESRNDNNVVLDVEEEEETPPPPPPQATFMITDVHSCADTFTERNVAKTIRKAVNAPTHSYVIHKHQGSMLSNMADLWKKGKLCDATIGNGTMKIMVHKIVLVALSPQLLSLPNTNLTSGCFQLTFPQEIGGDALWAFAKYMYEGVVSLNVDVLEDMERISKILNLKDLQDMCNLYRNQVNLPKNTSLSRSSVVTNSDTRDAAINLDTLQPSVTSESAASGVSFFSLPSGDITQTVSRPVQHLQILSTESNDHQLPYSSNQSPTTNMKLSPEDRSSCITISPSGSDSDCTVVTSSVKQEPSSPVSVYHEKDFLSSLPSRQSQSQVFVRDDLSEPWQPRSYCGNDVTSPSPLKQLKLTDELERNNPQTFKIELTGLNHKQNDVPYPISLVPTKNLDTT